MKPFAIPKTLGAAADLLYKLREEKATLNRQIKVIEDQETSLREHFIAELPKSEAGGISGKVANVVITRKTVPSVKDWEKLHEYIRKTKSFEIFQRRLNPNAIAERWEAGKEVPGVESFVVVGISVTKVK